MPKSELLCINHCCRRPRQKGRRKCVRCRTREFREAHPIAYLLNNTRHHAAQRGIEFTLTREQFEEFCLKHNYHLLKGRTADAMTIDRRDSNGPYSIDNIRPLSNSANASKRDRDIAEPEKYTADEHPFN